MASIRAYDKAFGGDPYIRTGILFCNRAQGTRQTQESLTNQYGKQIR